MVVAQKVKESEITEQDAWEEVDPDELSYEELLALGETVVTKSRDLSADTIGSLPSVNYESQGTYEGISDSRHPLVKWAQRSAVLFITVELPDAKDVKLNLDPEGKFYFSATSGADSIPYEIDLDLYDKVDVNIEMTSLFEHHLKNGMRTHHY